MIMEKKLAMFWQSAMNEDLIEQQGLAPLKELLLDQLETRVNTVTELIEFIGILHSKGCSCVFDATVIPDFKDSTTERLLIGQGGLGLPDKEYYLDEDKAEMRTSYIEHVGQMLQLAGSSAEEAQRAAEKVLQLETQLASESRSKTEMRDITKLYNPVTFDELKAQKLDWTTYFHAIGFDTSKATLIINSTPSFFGFLGDQLTMASIGDWKLYLQWHILRNFGAYLSSAFVAEKFKLQQVLSGTKVLEPRWKRVLHTINGVLGELLGQVYCKDYFRPESKTKCLEMIERVRQALHDIIQHDLDWMSEATKSKALEKLAAMNVKIGYPDEWVNYSALEVLTTTSYVDNVMRAQHFEHQRDMARVNGPVNPHRWEMAPQVVNAYFHPLKNEIVFPAAVLQTPAFDATRDDALNYGAMGAVMAHEITHGFDDQGRLFDAEGNMREWWAPDDAAKFQALADVVVAQFGQYHVCGRPVNGALTQGENIADIGGVKIAYRALQSLYREHGRAADACPDEGGFSPEQRFFLSWAQFWASAVRPAQALKLIAVDPHSPSSLRAYAPLKNLPEFHAAFDVKASDAMYLAPEDRMTIWG